MCKINLNFISKNPFEISILQEKVIDKIQKGCLKMSKKNPFQPPLWILSITFCWRNEISNGFLEMKSWLILHIYLVQSFWRKYILLCLNVVWNSTSNTISTYDLTLSGWAPTNSNLHIPHGLFYLIVDLKKLWK